jgi:hypothetical protein
MSLGFDLKQVRWTKVLAVLSLSIFPSGSAEAQSIALALDTQVTQSIIMMLSSTSSCVAFSYDLNGNRTAQSVSTIGSSATNWGSGSFGCFLWHS